MEHFFCILSVLARLVSLISTKTKEYFFGRHLCIRSINFLSFFLAKNGQLNLVLVLDLVLESKGPYY